MKINFYKTWEGGRQVPSNLCTYYLGFPNIFGGNQGAPASSWNPCLAPTLLFFFEHLKVCENLLGNLDIHGYLVNFCW